MEEEKDVMKKDVTKSARSKSDKCIEHGGGKRCNEEECTKSAQK